MFFLGRAQPGLRHEVAKRQWRWQFSRAPRHLHMNLVLDNVQRGVVNGQVVHQQQQGPVAGAAVLDRHCAQHRRLAQVDAVAVAIEAVAQLLCHVTVGGIARQLLQRQRCMPPHHLYRLGQVVPQHGGAQHIVPIHHGLQGLHEGVQTAAVLKAE